MTISELTLDQRIESFVTTRLSDFQVEPIKFNKKGLAEFCLKEIDYACELIKNTDIKDVEEQLED